MVLVSEKIDNSILLQDASVARARWNPLDEAVPASLMVVCIRWQFKIIEEAASGSSRRRREEGDKHYYIILRYE